MKNIFVKNILLIFVLSTSLISQTKEVQQFVSSMLGESPLEEDLQELCDVIGGRASGSKNNLESVEWGLKKFHEAGVSAKKEAFTVPRFWLENKTEGKISGAANFDVRLSAMPFSISSKNGNFTGELISAGKGTDEELQKVNSKMKDKFLFIESDELKDIDGLFVDYANSARIEKYAIGLGVKGIVYMGSRPSMTMFRHNASLGEKNKTPLFSIAREHGARISRLLNLGKKLSISIKSDIEEKGEYESFNVVAEIKGRTKPDEIVLIGAHLDSWDLGQGANDNGCNISMMIDLARQITKLGIKPKRTIRFVLWNGEEQGMFGSWKYTNDHANELDNHVMIGSIDIGSGRINGFFTNGRADVYSEVGKALKVVSGFGPFNNLDEPVVGTDNYDFMLHGVPNFVGNHEPQVYGPTYHAESDTYDKVDLRQLRINGAVTAAVIWYFANEDVKLPRHKRADVQKLIDNSSLRSQMDMFNLYPYWENGSRGIK
ncbi:MAG: M20/M25/M40 family metallo-hydrolase [Bacteroidetes bacterium]|nr:M20/M25/M40 family metallo-hydrolase [Bacteroidota bacterium]